MRHDHPIEWVWLAMAIVDVWVSLSSWLAAHQDWTRAKTSRALGPTRPVPSRSSRDAVTYAIEVSACLNAAMASMLMFAAITSLFLPPPPPNYAAVPQSLFVIGILIAVSGLNAVIAGHGRLVRYRLSTGYYERAGTPAGHVIAEAYKDKEPP